MEKEEEKAAEQKARERIAREYEIIRDSTPHETLRASCDKMVRRLRRKGGR